MREFRIIDGATEPAVPAQAMIGFVFIREKGYLHRMSVNARRWGIFNRYGPETGGGWGSDEGYVGRENALAYLQDQHTRGGYNLRLWYFTDPKEFFRWLSSDQGI